mgnify:CR=1 FL=1
MSACWWRGAYIGGGRDHLGLRLPFGLGVPWGRARLVGELLGLAAAGLRSGLAGWGRGGKSDPLGGVLEGLLVLVLVLMLVVEVEVRVVVLVGVVVMVVVVVLIVVVVVVVVVVEEVVEVVEVVVVAVEAVGVASCCVRTPASSVSLWGSLCSSLS